MLLLGGAPTSICYFFCPSICMCIHLLHWYLQVFCVSFSKFWFFRLLGEVKVQKSVQNDKHSVSHAPYLRNHSSGDCHLCYTCVKWYISKWFFDFFKILIFQVVMGLKVQKMVQNNKKILSITLHISGTIYHMTVIYGTHV